MYLQYYAFYQLNESVVSFLLLGLITSDWKVFPNSCQSGKYLFIHQESAHPAHFLGHDLEVPTWDQEVLYAIQGTQRFGETSVVLTRSYHPA